MALLPEAILDALSARSAFIPEVVADLGNPDWEGAGQHILIVRLSLFRDVQKSSSHLLLFSEVRSALPQAYIDFSFLPDRQDREALDAKGLAWFCGLVSGRSPSDYDLILVSNAFGLELVNLPYLFSTAAMPLRSSTRRKTADGGLPAVILGGSNAASAGCLLFGEGDALSDCFVDGIFFGEGEGAIGELARILTLPATASSSRLEAAEAVQGFWRAGSGRPAKRRVARPLPPPLVGYPVFNSEEASTARLQITAGCPGYCSFCLEGWDRRPYREASLAEILEAARRLRAASGAETLELYSFNFNTHADLYDLLFELNRIFRRVNLMSQRLDILARDRLLLPAELAADKRSFTLGVEGISARMRRFYRKGLEDRDLDLLLERLLVRGIRELKLFYILSGFEEEADFAEFAAFVGSMKERRDSRAEGLRIMVSAGYLVRLPFTPLQFASLAIEEEELRQVHDRVKSICEQHAIEFRLAVDFGDYLADQLFALGGRVVAEWLETLPRKGFVYEESLSRAAVDSLKAQAADAGLFSRDFVGEKTASWRPPLAFIEEDSHHGLLHEQYEEARACRDRALCLGGPCSDCGACEESEDRRFLVTHRSAVPTSGDYAERLGRLVAAKRGFPRVLVRLELPPGLAGARPEYRSSWVLRRLGSLVPGIEHAAFEAEELLFSRGRLSRLLPAFHGLCVFGISGPDPAAIRAAARTAGFMPIETMPEPSHIVVELNLERPRGSDAYAALRVWLREERVECIERRVEGARILSPSPRDRKKGLVYRISIDAESAEAGFRCTLELGPKAALGGWLRRLEDRAARTASFRVLGFDEG